MKWTPPSNRRCARRGSATRTRSCSSTFTVCVCASLWAVLPGVFSPDSCRFGLSDRARFETQRYPALGHGLDSDVEELEYRSAAVTVGQDKGHRRAGKQSASGARRNGLTV